MIRAFIFDLDGTIIDSEKVAFQAILECYKEWGVRVQEADASMVAGKKWEVAFESLFKKYPLSAPPETISRRILQLFQEKMRRDLQVIPGVVPAIHMLAKRAPLGLVSGSHRADILWALGQLGVRDHFGVVLGAEDYPQSKPAPDGYLQALQLMGVKAEEALVFEDSAPGIASARAAGIRVVAVTAANHFSHKLDDAQAAIHDFTQVDADWIKNLEKKLWAKR